MTDDLLTRLLEDARCLRKTWAIPKIAANLEEVAARIAELEAENSRLTYLNSRLTTDFNTLLILESRQEEKTKAAERERDEARKALEQSETLVGLLRDDLLRFVREDCEMCEGCGAPIDYDEEPATTADVCGCWGYVADVKDAPCYRYRTKAGVERSWPECTALEPSP